MITFLLGTAVITAVSLALRIAIDELATRWANGALDTSRGLLGS